MKTMSAREAKNGFGLMIDTARAEPVLIEKHGAAWWWSSRWRNMNGCPCNLAARTRGKRGPRGRQKRPMKRSRVKIDLVFERVVATGIRRR